MSEEKLGSMVRQPALSYDWVVPDFLNWTKTKTERDFVSGPDFVIQNKTFCFECCPQTKTIRLRGQSPPVTFTRFSFSLIGVDGLEKQMGSRTSDHFWASPGLPVVNVIVGRLFANDLTPNFLPNGDLRFRCRIEFKSGENNLAEVFPTDGTTLVDLRREFADQPLAFTDCVLVRFIYRI